MKDIIEMLIGDKGFMIGFLSGLMKVMQDIRMKSFVWYVALTDVFASSVVVPS